MSHELSNNRNVFSSVSGLHRGHLFSKSQLDQQWYWYQQAVTYMMWTEKYLEGLNDTANIFLLHKGYIRVRCELIVVFHDSH